MSLPLPRRFAQAALLLGAAAAPLIGAGAAHAASLPAPGLGGLSSLDGAGLGDAAGGASHQATVLAADAATDAMKTALPTADHLVGTFGHSALPVVQQAATGAPDAAGRLLGGTVESATAAVPHGQELPTAHVLPALGGTHAAALPATGKLPLPL